MAYVDCDCYSLPCEHNPRGNDLAQSKPNGDPIEPPEAPPVAPAAEEPSTNKE